MNISRRDFIRTMSSGLAFFPVIKELSAQKKTDRPNILYIMADDFASEAISCYNSWLKGFAKTPNIDRIAQEGMRFINVCCNNSICSPSRASIITGQYSHKNGVLNLGGAINGGSPWFTIELKKCGYQTALFGKWHLGNTPAGFDDYWVVKGQGRYFDPELFGPRGNKKVIGYATDIFTDAALDWLKKRDKTKPFCLLLHHKAPHGPFDYPERLKDLYENTDITEPFNLHEDVSQTSPLLKAKHVSHIYIESSKTSGNVKKSKFKSEGSTEKEKRSNAYQSFIHKYVRCITAVDQNVGRILEYLDKENLVQNTVLIFTSDQGYWLGEHGFLDKRLILEESIKMPLIVRFPAEIKPGTTSEKLVINIDYAPTILDFAGCAVPKSMQGRSIRPLLQGKIPSDWRTGTFYAYWAREPYHWGLRTDRYKLVHFPQTPDVELYDLAKDPYEMKNEARNPEYKKVIDECEKQLAQLMIEIDILPDQLPSSGKTTKQKKEKKKKK